MEIITPIELNLSSEWKQQEVLFGTLHSRFERVQNYLFLIGTEKRMLTIMCEGNALLPDSMILRQEDYAGIKKQGEHVRIALSEITSCSLLGLSVEKFDEEAFAHKKKQLHNFMERSEKKSDFERLPERYSKYIYRFAETLESNDSERMVASFLALAGAGRGLTPAADDAVIGVLAGYLLQLSLKKKSHTYLKNMEPLLSLLCGERLTTEISCKYLKCACRGDFSQNLCKLIRILSGEAEEDMGQILSQIREIGHSSGMDMLYGLACSIFAWNS